MPNYKNVIAIINVEKPFINITCQEYPAAKCCGIDIEDAINNLKYAILELHAYNTGKKIDPQDIVINQVLLNVKDLLNELS